MKKFLILLTLFISLILSTLCATIDFSAKRNVIYAVKDDIDGYDKSLIYINKNYSHEVNSRIIVKTDRQIDDKDAICSASGFAGLNVLQYSSEEQARKKVEYFSSLYYVEYATLDEELKLKDEGEVSVKAIVDTSGYLSWGAELLGIDRYKSHLLEMYGSEANMPTVYIGVLDTGIDTDHEFLSGRIATNLGKSYFDSDLYTSSDSQYKFEDDEGHGTHVSGTIVDLTCSNVRIIPIKVLSSDGTGSTSTVVSGIEYIIDLKTNSNINVTAINMSLGVYGNSTNEKNAVSNCFDANIMPVISAGNENYYAEEFSPAFAEKGLTISALSQNSVYSGFPYIAEYSNYGSIVDLCLPGSGIMSCVPDEYDTSTTSVTGGKYAQFNGTSMAAPHATALIGLYSTFYGNSYNVTTVENLIKSNTYDFGDVGKDDLYGYGVPSMSLAIDKYDLNVAPTINYGTLNSTYNFDSSINVEITNNNPSIDNYTYKIYYTVDGSVPTLINYTQYSNKITISNSTLLRFKIYLFDSSNKVCGDSDIYEVTYYKGTSNSNDDGTGFTINILGKITAYNSGLRDIVIPKKIGSITVRTIASNVFKGLNINSFTCLNNITIGDNSNSYPFYCSTVKSINISATGVTKIAKYCFGLKNLTLSGITSVPAGDKPSNYDDGFYGSTLFYGSTAIENFNAPNVTQVGNNSFSMYGKLKTVEFDWDNFTSIGSNAFDGTVLTEIDLSHCQTIGSNAFDDCHTINKVDLSSLTSWGEYPFYKVEKIIFGSNQNLITATDPKISKYTYFIYIDDSYSGSIGSYITSNFTKNYAFDNYTVYTKYTAYKLTLKFQTYEVLKDLYNYGDDILLPETCKIEDATYIIADWKDQSTSTLYLAGEKFEMPASEVTLSANNYILGGIDEYIVTFYYGYDYDNSGTENDIGDIISTEVYHKNDAIVPPQTNPQRPSTEMYDYTFTGWTYSHELYTNDNLPLVIKSMNFYGTYSSTLRKYTIQWVNNSVVIYSEQLEYGEFPSYDSDQYGIPTKPNDRPQFYNYNFTGWSPNIAIVTQDKSYIAQYETINTVYTVYYYDQGYLVSQNDYIYNDYVSAPSYSNSYQMDKILYTFTGWTEDIDGESIEDIYELFSNNALCIYAVYSEEYVVFTITWLSPSGYSIYSEEIDYGELPYYDYDTYGVPSKSSTVQYNYNFIGWSPSVEVAVRDMTYTPQFEEVLRSYQITWSDCYGNLIYRTNINYGVLPVYDTDTYGEPQKEQDDYYTYTFAGWTPEIVSVSGDKIYFATFSSKIRLYTIRWLNYDKNVIYTEELTYLAITQYDTETYGTPQKAQTERNIYTFAGWDSEVQQVREDKDYTAVFSESTRYYSITWLDGDDNIIYSENLEYDDTPQYDSDIYGTPTKESIETRWYIYNFKSWSPEIVNVSQNAEYTAQFDIEYMEYTINYSDKGDILSTQKYKYYDFVKVYEYSREYDLLGIHYTFTNWSIDVDNEQIYSLYDQFTDKVLTLNSVYSEVYIDYTIAWYNEETLIYSQTYHYGEIPQYDTDTYGEPQKASDNYYVYSFDSWTPVISSVTESADYNAIFSHSTRYFNIVWANYNGTIYSELLRYSEMPNYDMSTYGTPTKPSEDDRLYSNIFSGWTPAITLVAEDITYTAIYQQDYTNYTVNYYDRGNIIQGKTYHYDEVIEEPQDYTNEYTNLGVIYTFNGWNIDVNGKTVSEVYDLFINYSLEINSKYSQEYIIYTVVWKTHTGDVIYSENMTYGQLPQYNFELYGEPQREKTERNVYYFKGWSPEVNIVTENIEYTATYYEETRYYEIEWINGNNVLIYKDKYEYQALPEYDTEKYGEPQKRSEERRWYSYVFTSWTPEIISVTDNKTYYAQFEKEYITYTVNYLDRGEILDTKTYNFDGVIAGYEYSNYYEETGVKYTFSGWEYEVENKEVNEVYELFDNLVLNVNSVYSTEYILYDIVWKNHDGEIIYTDHLRYNDTPIYNVEEYGTPQKSATERYVYTFDKWTPEITAVTGYKIYNATFTQNTRYYKVTWIDGNGEEIYTKDDCEYLYIPEYDIQTYGEPQKEEDERYAYQFSGWNRGVEQITGDVEYIAEFTPQARLYTINWLNGNGEILHTSYFEYEQMPEYNQETIPQKESENELDYTYIFDGWENITHVTQDADYMPKFTKDYVLYSLCYYDNEELVLTEKYKYNDIIEEYGYTNKYDTTETRYEITSWTPNVKGSKIADILEQFSDKVLNIVAIYTETEIVYTIKWIDGDNDIIYTETVHYGYIPRYDASVYGLPQKHSLKYEYTFIGWNTALEPTTEDIEFVAEFSEKIKVFTVTWIDGNNEIIYSKELEYGVMPEYDVETYGTPQKTSNEINRYVYEFTSWTPKINLLTEDKTYNAVFTKKDLVYTINYEDRGAILKSETYYYDSNIETFNYISSYTENGRTYRFKNWSVDTKNKKVVDIFGLFEDRVLTIQAEYEMENPIYNITWLNYDGTVIYVAEVENGELPIYDVEKYGKPQKEADKIYIYIFDEWDSEIVKATENRSYTAKFVRTYRMYTIQWIDGNGDTIYTEKLKYNDELVYDAETYGEPQKTATEYYAYKFDKWTEIEYNNQVGGNMTIHSEFRIVNKVETNEKTLYGKIKVEENNNIVTISPEDISQSKKLDIIYDDVIVRLDKDCIEYMNQYTEVTIKATVRVLEDKRSKTCKVNVTIVCDGEEITDFDGSINITVTKELSKTKARATNGDTTIKIKDGTDQLTFDISETGEYVYTITPDNTIIIIGVGLGIVVILILLLFVIKKRN